MKQNDETVEIIVDTVLLRKVEKILKNDQIQVSFSTSMNFHSKT